VIIAATKVWWYIARSAGVVAWALAALTVIWGLALSTRALGRRPGAPWLTDLHRFLGGLTVTFVGIHLVGLWADSYVEFGPVELFVPMASSWRPGAVALGVVAFYLLLAVEITSLAMRRLPKKWWKAIHLSSYAVYALGTVHLLTAGTDADNRVLLAAVLVSLGPILFFGWYRLIGPGRAASIRSGSPTGSTVGSHRGTAPTRRALSDPADRLDRPMIKQ